MDFADFIQRYFQINNRPELSVAYPAEGLGAIAPPELDY